MGINKDNGDYTTTNLVSVIPIN